MKAFRLMTAILLTVVGILLNISCSSENSRTADNVILFQETAQDSIPYRIPCIGQFSDGRILALSDYRICKLDIGYGRVDIRYRMSDRKGREWGKETVLIEGNGVSGTSECGFGDAAMAIDRESDEVLIITVCGNTVYISSSTNRQNPNRVARLRSFDKGRTWSEWEEITEDIYSLFDESSHGCIHSCFFSSGKITQSRSVKVGSHYRLYHVLTARPNGNRVLYSDDFGKSWKVLGGIDALPVPAGDEAKCEELPDGSVVVSSRVTGGRLFNVFRFTDEHNGSWGEPIFSGETNGGCTAVENACNGEILMIPAIRTEDGKKITLALQSVPLGPGRKSVGIYYKEVEGGESSQGFAADWNGPYNVTQKPSAYSTMIQLKNGNIGFYYEESDHIAPRGYDMVYKEILVHEICSGRYVSVK